MGEGGGEGIDWSVKMCPKSKVGERWWEAIDYLVEGTSKGKVSERGWKGMNLRETGGEDLLHQAWKVSNWFVEIATKREALETIR